MYREIHECRCCGHDTLYKYLDLGDQPLANDYRSDRDARWDRFPLHVNLCPECYHSQLSVVVDPAMMFKHYLYVSGTTQTFRNHCRSLAEYCVGRKGTGSVLDIACNDGTLLEEFRRLGCEVHGVDPAENLREFTEAKGIDVLVDFWDLEAPAKLGRKFDIITGTNVFAHVDDAFGFLVACARALQPNGVVVLEFPYCDQMIEHVEFDTIYHEHLSYFLVNSFLKLCERVGFYIADVVRSPIHGGSIRFVLSNSVSEDSPAVAELVAAESERGLLTVATYDEFSRKVHKNKEDLARLVSSLRSEGYTVAGYGASAKGNTMLNHFNVQLDYIVDDNPLKWNHVTPGMAVPIKCPDTLAIEGDKLAVVILSWNFFAEIKQKINHIRAGRTTKCVLYVPDVKTVE